MDMEGKREPGVRFYESNGEYMVGRIGAGSVEGKEWD
jgi:hypothetical protein